MPMFPILLVLPLIFISIYRFPNALAIHLTFFEIARISHSYLPQILAVSVKFVAGVYAFVRIAILEVLLSFSMFHPLMKMPAVSAFFCR